MPFDCYRLLPQYWFQVYYTDMCFDKLLNDLLDSNPHIRYESNFIVINSNTYVMCSNFPYAYGYLFKFDIKNKKLDRLSGLPSVSTRLRLKQKQMSAFMGVPTSTTPLLK